jgi:hypothetical protein
MLLFWSASLRGHLPDRLFDLYLKPIRAAWAASRPLAPRVAPENENLVRQPHLASISSPRCVTGVVRGSISGFLPEWNGQQ